MSSENGRQDLAVQLFEVQLDSMLDKGIDLVGRSVQLVGEIDESTFKFIDAAFTILENQNRKAITLKIVSGGGDIYSALAIISRMRSSTCKITTEGHGYVMSAATAILAAGSKRRLSNLATFMWHEASYEVGGKHAEVKAWIEQFDKEEERWAELMAKFSTATAIFWLDSAKHTDKFFTPDELIELGVIDEIF